MIRPVTRPTHYSQRGGIFFKLLLLMFLIVFVFALYLIRRPIMRLAGGFWIVDDRPVPADAIVILGDDDYQGDRAAEAAQLCKSGWAPRVIASGPYLRPYASIADLEARDVMRDGVPQSSIVPFSHHADNTHEEGQALAQLLTSHGWKRVIVVTSNYHTRRARYILERTLPSGTVMHVVPARDSNYDPDVWWHTRKGVKLFFHETVGMVVAMWELRNRDVQTLDSTLEFGSLALPGGGYLVKLQ